MKDGIHPKYEKATIQCACGTVIETRSTRKEVKVEICSSCHPFYTGKTKVADAKGRIESFKKKYEKITAAKK